MAYNPIGDVKLSMPKVSFDGMTVGAACCAAGMYSTELGKELKPLEGLTVAGFKFYDIFKAVSDASDLTSAVTSPQRSMVEVAKRVSFLAIGIMVTVKVLVVKMGVGMNWVKVNAPRFARLITSKAFPQVLCICSVARTSWKIYDKYNSTDATIRDAFYSDAAKEICFMGYELAENVFPGLKAAQGALFVGGAVFGSLNAGQV